MMEKNYLQHGMFEEGSLECPALSSQVRSDCKISKRRTGQMRKPRWELYKLDLSSFVGFES